MSKRFMATLGVASGLLTLAACSGHGGNNPLSPTLDPSPSPIPDGSVAYTDLPDATLMPTGVTPDGMAIGALGFAQVTIDPAMNISLAFPRSGMAQGDQTRLSVRPFIGPNEITPVAVRREVIGGVNATVLTLNFRHPFDTPLDLNQPSTATKRADLHAFKPIALVLTNGIDSFAFPGATDAVTTDAGLLVNASGYTKPGDLLNLPASYSATTFAYRHITPLDAASVTTNYNPTSGGWQGNDILTPTGYGVFAQGSSHDVEFALDIAPNTAITFDIAVLAEYQQPKANDLGDPIPKPRLPDPGDPDRLVYTLPSGAGDNSAIAVNFPGGNHLPTDDSTSIIMRAGIIDWDNQAGVVTGTYPDYTDLSLGPEPSGTAAATAVLPGVMLAEALGIPVSGGTGLPDAPLEYEFSLTNTALTTVQGNYRGLIRVEDQQAGVNVLDLGEVANPDGTYSLGAPLTSNLPTVTYQLFEVVVEDLLCGQVDLAFADGAGNATINNGDTVRFVATRANGGVPAAPWTIDLAYSGALVEDLAAVSGVDLSTPYSSAASTAVAANPTRASLPINVDRGFGNPLPVTTCLPLTVNVAANAQPTCPTTQILTDETGGPLGLGDRPRIAFSGITDADNTLATVVVSADFDYNGDGTPEETIVGTALDSEFIGTAPLGLGGGLVRVTLTLADNAGPIAPCAPVSQLVPGICTDYTAAILDQTGSTTLNNGDTIRLRFSPSSAANWLFDPVSFAANMSGPTDFLGVATTGTTPINTALSTARIVNGSRGAVAGAFGIDASVTKDAGNVLCPNLTGVIAGNSEPTCPITISILDQSGSASLDDGDTVRVTWSGITDADNLSAEIMVSVDFDFDNNGTIDETRVGSGFASSVLSSGIVAYGQTVRVVATLSDNAGAIPACPEVTKTVSDVCANYTPQIQDQLGTTTINNNDNVRIRFTPTLAGTWSFDPQNFTANMTAPTDLANVNTTGVIAVNTANSTATVVNNTRVAITSGISVMVDATRDTTTQACGPVLANIAANVAPACTTQVVTDPTATPVGAGDPVRITWTITDADNTQAQIAVSAAFDFDNNGSTDETVVGTAASGFLQSTTTAILGNVIRVQLTLTDNAGSTACTALTVCVLSTVGNVTLETITTGSTPRSGVGANQPITGVRVSWPDIPGEGGYAVYRALWSSTTTLVSAQAFSQIGTTAANVTFYNDTTANAAGNRYLYLVYPRCGVSTVNGPVSEYAMAALQNFEAAAYGQLNGTGTLATDWVLNYTDAGNTRQEIKIIGPLDTLSGTRTLEVTEPAGGTGDLVTRWCALSTPGLQDFAGLGPVSMSRLEFQHEQFGTWNTNGGFSLFTRDTRPANLGATAGGGYTWAGTSVSGMPFNDNSSTNLDTSFGATGHPVTPWAFGNASGPFTETFSAFDMSAGTFGPTRRYMFLGFSDTTNDQLYYRLDDIAWLVF